LIGAIAFLLAVVEHRCLVLLAFPITTTPRIGTLAITSRIASPVVPSPPSLAPRRP
jgi:hypothetical protein